LVFKLVYLTLVSGTIIILIISLKNCRFQTEMFPGFTLKKGHKNTKFLSSISI